MLLSCHNKPTGIIDRVIIELVQFSHRIPRRDIGHKALMPCAKLCFPTFKYGLCPSLAVHLRLVE